MPMLGIRAINYIRMHDGFIRYFSCIRMYFYCLFVLEEKIGDVANDPAIKFWLYHLYKKRKYWVYPY